MKSDARVNDRVSRCRMLQWLVRDRQDLAVRLSWYRKHVIETRVRAGRMRKGVFDRWMLWTAQSIASSSVIPRCSAWSLPLRRMRASLTVLHSLLLWLSAARVVVAGQPASSSDGLRRHLTSRPDQQSVLHRAIRHGQRRLAKTLWHRERDDVTCC